MEPVNGFKIYQINDCDCYLGRTPQEAVAAYCEDAECEVPSAEERSKDDGYPVELTESDLDKRRIRIESDNGDYISRTFRQQLMAEPPSEPCMFASTEY